MPSVRKGFILRCWNRSLHPMTVSAFLSHTRPFLPILVMGLASMCWHSSCFWYLLPLLTLSASWNPVARPLQRRLLTVPWPRQLDSWLLTLVSPPFLCLVGRKALPAVLPQGHTRGSRGLTGSPHSFDQPLVELLRLPPALALFLILPPLPTLPLRWTEASGANPNPTSSFSGISHQLRPHPSARTTSPWHLGRPLSRKCCLREDGFSSFHPKLFYPRSLFPVHFLPDCFHGDVIRELLSLMGPPAGPTLPISVSLSSLVPPPSPPHSWLAYPVLTPSPPGLPSCSSVADAPCLSLHPLLIFPPENKGFTEDRRAGA